MSASEQIVWFHLRKRKLGYLFRRQYAVGNYILDFFCPAAQVAVEIDGEQHLERADYDARRDQWFAENGILTIRIPSLDIFEKSLKFEQWIQHIHLTCIERAGPMEWKDEE